MAAAAGGGVEAKRVFIGTGCNRVVNNVSWGASGLVSFGAQNAVAVFSPKIAQILTTLPGHKAAVNCTFWIPNSKFSFKAGDLDRHYLFSGDADGIIILWELSVHDGKWRQVLQVPESHRKGVTCITGFMFSKNEVMVVSTSSDCTINIWDLVFLSATEGGCTMSFVDSISVGSKSMVALSVAELPGNAGQVVLATGGLDNKVHLYCGSRSGKFVHACELKGHTDWVRSLDLSFPVSIEGRGESLLLASSSQDKTIRIWKISSHSSSPDTNEELSLTSYIEGPILVAGSSSYQISMESLLVGHEDWTYSVQWQPPVASSGGDISCHQPLSLLSSSMDKTMMIWQPERTTGIWMNVVTVGELSHCALGFYGGHWSPNGQSILAHGYGGTFHMWENVGCGSDDWQPQIVPSGHFAAVSDISWARSGEYVLSVSHDQTTRVFAPWKDSSQSSDPWHEIARPQVHGHDINCVSIIRGNGNHRFISGADEKVSRVFEAPWSFLKTLNRLTSQSNAFPESYQPETQILGANMSALGLSQKPIYVHAAHETTNKSGGEGFDTLEAVPDAVPVVLTKPPVEEQLAWHTLWPETHKLYGHGNELYSLCCDRSGTLIASSCKAQSAAVAEIWLWQVGTWKAIGRLHSHNLTITQMEFSHDDKMLLAVSRDRKFSVFSIKRKGTDEIDHQLLEMKEAHKRIIWACSWNPFGHEFATGSRDKTVKIWSVLEGTSVTLLVTLPQFTSSVTALSWLGLDRQRNKGLLAVGMESGLIELWTLRVKEVEVSTVLATRLDPLLCHVSAVNRLAWLNPGSTDHVNIGQLASCGADHCVRIFEVNVDSE